MKYAVIDNFDVWGNSPNGYVVNSNRDAGTIELISLEERDILRAMKKAGHLNSRYAYDRFVVEGGPDSIFIESRGGMPLFELYSVDSLVDIHSEDEQELPGKI